MNEREDGFEHANFNIVACRAAKLKTLATKRSRFQK